MSALSAVQSAIVRLFRADMAVAAGLPEDPPPPLAETLARLDEMHARVHASVHEMHASVHEMHARVRGVHARVREMIAVAPPRTERTRAGDREDAA